MMPWALFAKRVIWWKKGYLTTGSIKNIEAIELYWNTMIVAKTTGHTHKSMRSNIPGCPCHSWISCIDSQLMEWLLVWAESGELLITIQLELTGTDNYNEKEQYKSVRRKVTINCTKIHSCCNGLWIMLILLTMCQTSLNVCEIHPLTTVLIHNCIRNLSLEQI